MSTDSELNQLMRRIRQFAQERDWEQFHSPKNLAMALLVECAEVLEHFQWSTEDESHRLSSEDREKVAHELADVFIYLLRLADQLGVDLGKATSDKLQINAERYPVDLVRGSARKYNDY